MKPFTRISLLFAAAGVTVALAALTGGGSWAPARAAAPAAPQATGPVVTAAPAPPVPGAPLPSTPSPLIPSPAASPNTGATPEANRVHLHRPGSDVDGDVLTGNVASDIYVIKGNVTLHSDPKVDREIGAQTESSDPLTITADEIDIDKTGLSYVAKGNVRFTQGLRSGSADLAMLNEGLHTLDLIGNADVREGERRAVAAKMHYNTLDKQFLGAGNVRIYEPLPAPKPAASGTPHPKHRRGLPF